MAWARGADRAGARWGARRGRRRDPAVAAAAAAAAAARATHLGADLVAALAGLDVHNLTHFDGRLSAGWQKTGRRRGTRGKRGGGAREKRERNTPPRRNSQAAETCTVDDTRGFAGSGWYSQLVLVRKSVCPLSGDTIGAARARARYSRVQGCLDNFFALQNALAHNAHALHYLSAQASTVCTDYIAGMSCAPCVFVALQNAGKDCGSSCSPASTRS